VLTPPLFHRGCVRWNSKSSPVFWSSSRISCSSSSVGRISRNGPVQMSVASKSIRSTRLPSMSPPPPGTVANGGSFPTFAVARDIYSKAPWKSTTLKREGNVGAFRTKFRHCQSARLKVVIYSEHQPRVYIMGFCWRSKMHHLYMATSSSKLPTDSRRISSPSISMKSFLSAG
jgi:hypothetical protein